MKTTPHGLLIGRRNLEWVELHQTHLKVGKSVLISLLCDGRGRENLECVGLDQTHLTVSNLLR